MKSRLELDIDAPRDRLAALLADPNNNPKWMDDIERIDPVRGELGEPGSVYRVVPKKGKLVFVATVVRRALPTQLGLLLDAPRVSVVITDTFRKLSEDKTRLISEVVLRFKGAFGKIIGVLARRPIKRAHRRHMESFKRFAESHAW